MHIAQACSVFELIEVSYIYFTCFNYRNVIRLWYFLYLDDLKAALISINCIIVRFKKAYLKVLFVKMLYTTKNRCFVMFTVAMYMLYCCGLEDVYCCLLWTNFVCKMLFAKCINIFCVIWTLMVHCIVTRQADLPKSKLPFANFSKLRNTTSLVEFSLDFG